MLESLGHVLYGEKLHASTVVTTAGSRIEFQTPAGPFSDLGKFLEQLFNLSVPQLPYIKRG